MSIPYLDSSERVAHILATQQVLLLGDPGLLLLHVGNELLEGERLLELLAAVGRQVGQLPPVLVQARHARADLVLHQIRLFRQARARFLHLLSMEKYRVL